MGRGVPDLSEANNETVFNSLVRIALSLQQGPADTTALAKKLFPSYQQGFLSQQDWSEGMDKLLDMLSSNMKRPKVLQTTCHS